LKSNFGLMENTACMIDSAGPETTQMRRGMLRGSTHKPVLGPKINLFGQKVVKIRRKWGEINRSRLLTHVFSNYNGFAWRRQFG